MVVLNMLQLEYACQDIFRMENILMEEPGGAQRGDRALRGFAFEEGVHPRVSLFGDGDRKIVEGVRAARIDSEFGAIAGGDIARVHEERIVEQAVARADGKQCGRETF